MIVKKCLPNGLRIVCEPMQGFRSVSISVWVAAGSVYESDAENGISHFIEHMLFKGTNKRSAGDIAEQGDIIGGNLNAFTSKEYTCFYTKVLDDNLEFALELLSDIICNSKLDNDDIEREKGVVLEEIAMNNDSPEDLAQELLCQNFFLGNSLAAPILGNEDTVKSFNRHMLVDYMQRMYRPSNMVISVAGSVDAQSFIPLVEKYFSMSEPVAGNINSVEPSYAVKDDGLKLVLKQKDIEQAHISLGFKGFPILEDGYFPMVVLNNAVGGSMSSRLFQSIRENNGLAYSVYSSPASFAKTGYFALYAGTAQSRLLAVTELMLSEYKKIAQNGITSVELERARKQLKSSYLLGLENTSSRASSNGRNTLMGIPLYSGDEIIEKLYSVSLNSINEILPVICDFKNMTAVVVGNVESYKNDLDKLLAPYVG